ncbi:MAG: response regulator [Candidatus Wolfebacteria bacterium]|nr:response regulator [Candidatus Wolfebacteria bacterium]
MAKILLVEDDPFLSSLLKNRLQKEGFEIALAKDGEQAISNLRSDKYDIVLLDIILPKKSGFEVLEEIRQDPILEKMGVIIISNLGQPEDMAKGRQFGVIEYFVKAKTSIDDLVSKIKDIMISETSQP